jgi:hypothetical protein
MRPNIFQHKPGIGRKLHEIPIHPLGNAPAFELLYLAGKITIAGAQVIYRRVHDLVIADVYKGPIRPHFAIRKLYEKIIVCLPENFKVPVGGGVLRCRGEIEPPE